jgi:hypothetical protein
MNPKKKIRGVKQKEESRWRREQKGKGVKKRFRLVKLWILVFASFAFLGLGIKGWLSYRHRIWDGQSRLNIALAGEETCLLSLDPVDSELVLVEIPSETEVEVAFGYGVYPINSVYELSQLEKKEGEILAETLENNFAVPVEGWYYSPHEIDTSSVKEPKSLLTRLIFSRITPGVKTNLTFWDLSRLWLVSNNVSVFRANFFNLSNLNLLEEVELPEIDEDRLDAFTQQYFQEKKLGGENLVIEVINSTKLPGLAEKGARLLTNIGVEVVGVGNQEEKVSQCLLIGESSIQKNYLTQRVMGIFGCNWREGQEGKGDLTLILGEEFQERF